MNKKSLKTIINCDMKIDQLLLAKKIQYFKLKTGGSIIRWAAPAQVTV